MFWTKSPITLFYLFIQNYLIFTVFIKFSGRNKENEIRGDSNKKI